MPTILRNHPLERTVHHLLMLDASGSMKRLMVQALDAANEIIQTARNLAYEYADKQEHRFTLVTFNTSCVSYIYKDADTLTIEELPPSIYHPNGGTPLYDTIGQVLTLLEMNVADNDKVLVKLITEGHDTASQEYTFPEITQMLTRLRLKGWTIDCLRFCPDIMGICNHTVLCHPFNLARCLPCINQII